MASYKTITLLTLLMSILISFAAITGIASPGFYANETGNWRIQTIGQDYINLCLVVPFLLNTALMIYKHSQSAKLLWAGAVSYVVYTYTIYCFDVHFNSLFIVYCFILGLGIFSIIYFIYSHRNTLRYTVPGKSLGRLTAIYFIAISVLFGGLWLFDILHEMSANAISGGVLKEGFFTNPVQVIDLSVCLPGLFISGLLLLQRKKPGFVLSAVLLTFLVLMSLTVGILSLLLNTKDTLPVAAWLMFGLAVFSLVLLTLNLRSKTAAV